MKLSPILASDFNASTTSMKLSLIFQD